MTSSSVLKKPMPRCALTAVTIVQQVRMEDPGRGGVWKRSLIINTTQDPTRSLLLLVLIWSKSKMMEKVCTFSVFSAPPRPSAPPPLSPPPKGGAVKKGSGVTSRNDVIFLRFCKLGLGKIVGFTISSCCGISTSLSHVHTLKRY